MPMIDVEPVKPNRTGQRRPNTEQYSDKAGFTGGTRADDRKRVTFLELERHAPENGRPFARCGRHNLLAP